MSFLFLGFFTGLSLILAIGAQNIFVIEQGLKKQYVFLVCLICSISDLILIFLGLFLFEYFKVLFTKTTKLFFLATPFPPKANDSISRLNSNPFTIGLIIVKFK